MKTLSSLPLPIIERPAVCSEDGCSRDPFAPFRVSFWGSHPNVMDDCFSGCNYDDGVEALRHYFVDTTNYHVQYVVLDGPGVYYVRKNPMYDPKRIANASIGFDAWFNEGEPVRTQGAAYP